MQNIVYMDSYVVIKFVYDMKLKMLNKINVENSSLGCALITKWAHVLYPVCD